VCCWLHWRRSDGALRDWAASFHVGESRAQIAEFALQDVELVAGVAMTEESDDPKDWAHYQRQHHCYGQ
jgi:hypothetical protein